MKTASNLEAPVVFIILTNWNNPSDTIECLDSLIKIQYKNTKIVIIDNGSEDDSMEKFKQWGANNKIDFEVVLDTDLCSPSQKNNFLTIISLKENIGFGGANNVGIQNALKKGADFVLLLNNDTVVTEDFLSSLVKTALNTRKTGITGAKIKYFDDKDKIWFSGGYIDFLKGAFYHREDDCSGQRESDFITGCLMLIPSEVIKKVGCFDERYFLNVEDVDLSCRIKDAGYNLTVDCNAVVFHKVSASIGGLFSSRNQYYFHRNRMLFFSTRFRGVKKLLFYYFQFFIATPVWIIMQLFKKRGTAIKGTLVGYFDYLKGRFGRCKYF